MKTIRLLSIAPFAITLIAAFAGSIFGVGTSFFGVQVTHYGWEAFMWVMIAAVAIYWWVYLGFIGVIIATSIAIWKGKKTLKKADSDKEASIYEL